MNNTVQDSRFTSEMTPRFIYDLLCAIYYVIYYVLYYDLLKPWFSLAT